MSKHSKQNGQNRGSKQMFASGVATSGQPRTYTQLLSDKPSDVKPVVLDTMRRTSPSVSGDIIGGNRINGSYTFNLPWRDYLGLVSGIAKLIEIVADNWYRTYQIPLWKQWTGLVMLKQGENLDLTDHQTTVELACRLVNRLVKFIDGRTMLDGCLLNLLNASKFTGDKFKGDLSYACRWGKIQNASNNFAKWPAVKGQQDTMAKLTSYAVGTSYSGADVCCMGLWKTDWFGNVGDYTVPLDTLLTNNGKDGHTVACAEVSSSSTKNRKIARKLLQNINRVIKEYSFDKVEIRSTKEGETREWALRHPAAPDNGGVTVFKSTADDGTTITTDVIYRNKTTECQDLLNAGGVSVRTSTRLAETLWNNYNYILQYMCECFGDFMDPTSDVVRFFTDVIQILEPSKQVYDLKEIVYGNKNFDMIKDLMPHMVFRKDNTMNTATIINRMPVMGWQAGTMNSTDFDTNWKMIDTTQSSITKRCLESKSVPTIYPQSFPDILSETVLNMGEASFYPITLNTIQTTGHEGTPAAHSQPQNDDPSFIPSLLGKVGSLFDLACCSSVDVEGTKFNFLDTVAADALQYVNKCAGQMFEEDPTTVRCGIMPLINTSDPLQCGFNLWIDVDDVNPSDTANFWLDNHFARTSQTDELTGQHCAHYDVRFPGEQADTALGLHISDENYRRYKKSFNIFVGDNLLKAPEKIFSDIRSAIPEYSAVLFERSAENEGSFNYLNEFVQEFKSSDDGGYGAVYEIMKNSCTIDSTQDGSEGHPSVAINAINKINSCKKNGTIITEYLSNPAYGPIKPVTDAFVFDGYMPLNAFDGQSLYAHGAPCLAAPNVILGSLDLVTRGSTDAQYPLQLRAIHTTQQAPRHWTPGIADFTMRGISINPDNGLVKILGEVNVQPIYLVEQNSYQELLMSRVLIPWHGREDESAFWASPLVTDLGITFTAGNYKIDNPDAYQKAITLNWEVPVATSVSVNRDGTLIKPKLQRVEHSRGHDQSYIQHGYQERRTVNDNIEEDKMLGMRDAVTKRHNGNNKKKDKVNRNGNKKGATLNSSGNQPVDVEKPDNTTVDPQNVGGGGDNTPPTAAEVEKAIVS